ncbi:hypothetical protein PENSPDRAFT_310249 [Peniophora sp. CONT]|nr:hypothetical protein PENSPDRAFT_310249 [Peniophora sp. CONT]
MRLTLEERRLEIDLVDADSGVTLFTATSHPGRSSTEVTVTKRSDSPQAQHAPLAKLGFREVFADTIELFGEDAKKLKAKDYVRSAGKGRWEITLSGDVYIWSEAEYKDLKLHSSTGVELSHLRAPRHGDERPTGFFTLQILDEAVPSSDLDHIVVSCLYLKHVLKKTAHVGQQIGTAMANPLGNVGHFG